MILFNFSAQPESSNCCFLSRSIILLRVFLAAIKLSITVGLSTSLASAFSGELQVESINLLDAAITHQQRRVIRSQSYPESETVLALRKILEA